VPYTPTAMQLCGNTKDASHLMTDTPDTTMHDRISDIRSAIDALAKRSNADLPGLRQLRRMVDELEMAVSGD